MSGLGSMPYRRILCGSHQSSECDQILLFELMFFYRSWPKYGDMQCKPGVSKTMIWSHSERGGGGRWCPQRSRKCATRNALFRIREGSNHLFESLIFHWRSSETGNRQLVLHINAAEKDDSIRLCTRRSRTCATATKTSLSSATPVPTPQTLNPEP